MKSPLSTQQVMRFNRQIVLPQIDINGQEALARARVLVIGVGGLGTAAATSLCASGVGHITLVDDDCVEHTNLPRQTLFDETQIGQSKVAAAKQRLLQLNSDCFITDINSAIEQCDHQHLFAQHDLVLDCTDNTASRDLINALCYQYAVPLISGAAIRFEGQLFVAKPGVSQCYGCLRTLFDAPDLSCTEAGILSPIVNIVGTYQALLAMQLIMEVGSLPLNTLITFDGLKHEWQQWTLPAGLQCDICNINANDEKTGNNTQTRD